MPSVIYIFFKQCYLYKNEQGQNEIVTTLLPSSASAGKYIVTHNKTHLTGREHLQASGSFTFALLRMMYYSRK